MRNHEFPALVSAVIHPSTLAKLEHLPSEHPSAYNNAILIEKHHPHQAIELVPMISLGRTIEPFLQDANQTKRNAKQELRARITGLRGVVPGVFRNLLERHQGYK